MGSFMDEFEVIEQSLARGSSVGPCDDCSSKGFRSSRLGTTAGRQPLLVALNTFMIQSRSTFDSSEAPGHRYGLVPMSLDEQILRECPGLDHWVEKWLARLGLPQDKDAGQSAETDAYGDADVDAAAAAPLAGVATENARDQSDSFPLRVS